MKAPVHYNRWQDIPAHLQTRTQLAQQGLRPVVYLYPAENAVA